MTESLPLDCLLVRVNLGHVKLTDDGRALLQRDITHDEPLDDPLLADVTDLCAEAERLGLIRNCVLGIRQVTFTWTGAMRLHAAPLVDPAEAGAALVEWAKRTP